ncbi:MAG TPA: purine-nucleoside phosphorylase [Deltaproteobacteria bacterium]|nr:purine-nucleoside phosphorylase [Deltaproteobacteria bacterium]
MNTLSQARLYQKKLEASAAALRALGPPPDFAVIFGSGLGEAFVEKLTDARALAFSAIPHFPLPQVHGHKGELLYLKSLRGASSVMVLRGRVHCYEGYSAQEVVFPLRALARWGVKRLILTNASGSMRKRLKPGSLVMIRDHLNFTGLNPLSGPNLEALGIRFPQLRNLYRNPFSRQVAATARRLGLRLEKGVYVGISGPSYETDAEIQAYRKLGGDLIGMSTVHEAIAAAHAGMEVAALAAVTNSCLARQAPSHEAVLATAAQVDRILAKLLAAFLRDRRVLP